MEPDTVSVIVHSAQNLQGKKKTKHKYHVIFGIGQKRFRTEIVQDFGGSPKWNSESHIPILSSGQVLTLTVFERDEVLGQISLPVFTLPNTQPCFLRMPLQPHKKCPNPKGELTYKAWISKTRAASDLFPPRSERKNSTLDRLKTSLFSKSSGLRKALSTHYISSIGKKNSTSSQDLSGKTKNKSGSAKPLKYRSVGNLFSLPKETSWPQSEVLHQPEITMVHPPSGPVSGLTKLTICGEYLGTSKEDVLGLSICGSNCLSSLEWISSGELRCVTKPWQECVGDVVVTTASGGRGVGAAFYRFSAEQVDLGDPEVNSLHDSMGSVQASRSKRSSLQSEDRKEEKSASFFDKFKSLTRKNSFLDNVATAAPGSPAATSSTNEVSTEMLWEEVRRLRAEVETLRSEKEALQSEQVDSKQYIEQLLAKVIAHCPEILAKEPEASSDKNEGGPGNEFTMQL